MRDSVRLMATLIIWLAFTITLAVILTTPTGAVANADGPTVFGIVLVLALVALMSTVSVWVASRDKGADLQSRAKAKRSGGSRVEQLVEALDDDEIYDLEALLLARDQQAHDRRAGES